MSKTQQHPREEPKPKLNRKRQLRQQQLRQQAEQREPISARLLEVEFKPLG